MTDKDVFFMQRAIELARRGTGWVNPNPQVGAVIVKDGRIIGEGYHERYGGLHAERNAIALSTESVAGATLYTTLEPCCHTGKTPPCTEIIIEQKLARAVIGSHDPNPLAAGKGIALLKEAGIEVVCSFMQHECDQLNRIFFHYIQTGMPYVLMKYAMTLDGKTATRTGASRWITGEAAREDVHRLRGRYAAIMVGIGTVLADDPLLNCRITDGHNPLRIICDSHLRIPLNSQIAQTATTYPTLIVTLLNDTEKITQLKQQGCEVLVMSSPPQKNPTDGSHIDLKALMSLLGAREIDSVLIEGGPTLHASALEAGIVNRLRCYVAPKLFGGSGARPAIEGLGVATPDEAYHLTDVSFEVFGEDYCFEGEVG